MFHWDMPRVFGYPFGFAYKTLVLSLTPCEYKAVEV
ncbi:unnamed protein product [Brassica rapa subsp. trilocularis]